MGSKIIVVVLFTRGDFSQGIGALPTTMVIEPSVFVEGDLA
jgi:hypothetical protein